MRNLFAILFRARDKPKDAVSGAPSFYFGTSGSGKSVTAQSAIQLSTVYACVRVISETIASLPLGVFEATDTGNRKATEHPLYPLLHDEPNSEMTSFVLREVMLAHLLIYGNSYCQIIRTGKNGIIGLYPLLPDHMDVDRDSKGNLTYTYTTSDGRTVNLKPPQVLHIPGLGFDGVIGYSPINDAVEIQVSSFLSKLASRPREELLQMASARNTEMYKVALKQAEKEYENAQKQVTALEEEAVKALTGESALDLSVINTMIIKHRAKRDAAAQTIEEARARLEQEQMSQKETQAQIDEMLSWADCYDKANIETRHMIIARIIEKVEVRANRKIHIKFRISLDQFLGKSA